MNITSIILRMLLIAGLMVSPLYSRASLASGHAMTMSEAQTTPDQMSPSADADNATSPCHDGKMDCDKACPCMAACMSLSFQCLPSAASITVPAVVVKKHFAIRREAQLASLLVAPPARPPRA